MTLDDLALSERWPADRLAGLPGRVRGVVLRDWARNVSHRFGPSAVDAVRAALGTDSPALADQPDPEAWLPVPLLLRTADALLHDVAGGDPHRLVDLLHDATAAASPRVATWLARRLGPTAFFKKAPDAHPHLYDVGTVTASHTRDSVTFHCAGAALFAHPTWALLQLAALSALLRFLQRTPTRLTATPAGPDALTLTVAWR